MDESVKNSPCKECEDGDEGQLQAELEHLRQHLAERDSHIVALETEFIKCSSRTSELEEQVSTWREKYERLYDSHKRVQKLNQVLEDKLLQMVDKMKGEKSQLTRDIATLSVRLAESKHNYSMLQKENERYKNDMNLAIQLLQCKPDNFVSQKLDNLPVDTQARVSQYVMSKSSKPSSSNSAKNGNEIDTFDTSEYEFNISASLMTKILEDSIHDTVTKHCDTCTCSKTQNKPFSYNESYYSVATQTVLSGEMKNSLCLNCNADIKSIHSSLSIRSASPHTIKLVNDKTINHCATAPLYIIPQPIPETNELNQVVVVPEILKTLVMPNDKIIVDEKVRLEEPKVTSPNIGDDVVQQKRKNSMNMEPAVHHKLCDRTKTSMSSKKSSIHSSANEDLLIGDLNMVKDKIKSESHSGDMSLRKNSVGSMGGVSRTSSLAKSTVSAQNKSNTQVGPGPRFCHLRMQAGSKNILLDNAQPDVPPVLYRRQSKCNDNTIFKDLLNDGMDNFIDLEKNIDDDKDDCKNDNVVVESTLIDVHVDNNNKESDEISKDTSINPVLLNVSSSPLQPLKTHNFSNSSEYNNNNSHSIGSHRNTSDNDNLLNDFNTVPNVQNNNVQNNNNVNNNDTEKHDIYTPPSDNHDVKIFNFDRYEQNKLGSQYARPLRKIDMSQLHTLENTKISKDFPPQGEIPKLEKKSEAQQKTPIPAIVNVYPNLTQTHLKVNDNKKNFTNEQSTSSLSSDDSAALLQKQQLLRVAEWVEQNLEQQNNLNDPLEDDVSFSNRINRRESKLTRLSETLNELALNMPHPVSKYAKFNARDGHNNWVHNNVSSAHDKVLKHNSNANSSNVTKETVFPIDSGETTVVEVKKSDAIFNSGNTQGSLMSKELRDALKSNGDKDITREELARMEYNVKKFLLSGPHWANPESVGRSRRTSSKTETDV